MYVDLTQQRSCNAQTIQCWIKDFHLHQNDKDCLSKGTWLTDTLMDAGQSLLQKAFPSIGGLQPKGETLAFQIQKGQFVQILNVNRNHWTTVSNLMCPPGTVYVYDSLPSIDLHSRTKVQIAAILCSPEREINVGFPLVQIQHGGNDCGLFALAFATSLCDGENPAEINYIQNKLREHFLNCLERRAISKFPQRERKKAARFNSQTSYGIYCICRLPKSGDMICCDSCQEWYHEECVDAPQKAWKEEAFRWFCNACIIDSKN